MPDHIEFKSCGRKPEVKVELDVEKFFDNATLYGVDGYVWLVDWTSQVATQCSDETYREGWRRVYAPTYEWFLRFLKDEKHFEGRRRYPPYK